MSTTTKQSPATGEHKKRTLAFVGAAAVCLGITGMIQLASQPEAIREYGQVGKEFYPEFTDPTLASALEVSVIDPETVEPKNFEVKKQANGQWTIPSHHNYPTDAEDKLGRTAASVIGITRGAMVTRWPADHAMYKVVNPRQDALNVDEVEGVGSRLTLRSDDGTILADYIIGKKVDDGESNQYYVRHPDETEVYIADLEIDLSAKFADWIDTELLHVTSSDVTELQLHDYSFEETRQGITITETDTTTLKRDSSSDPWKMDGLDEANFEIDTTAVRETVNAIAGLSVAGVRKKQEGLTPDLRFGKDVDQEVANRIQTDLLTRGFLLDQDRETRELSLVAREGELTAATKDGLVYQLLFGRAFTGSQEELEIELSSSGGDAEEKASATEKDNDDTAQTEDATGESESKEGSTETDPETDGRPGRYVFVRVEFDEAYLGEPPVEPTVPVKPKELEEKETAAESSDADAAEEATDDATTDDAADEAAGDNVDADESAEDETLEKLRKEYEDAQAQYETDKREYENKVKQREDTIKRSKEEAEELNRRFADWYYVIPGADYGKLRLSRSDIVKEKEKTDEENGEGEDPTTEIKLPAADEVDETTPPEKTESESTEDDSADNNEASEGQPAGDAPADSEASPDEEPADSDSGEGESPEADPADDSEAAPDTEEEPAPPGEPETDKPDVADPESAP